MAIITTPGAGVSPYQTTDNSPNVLRAGANGATVLATVASAAATADSAAASAAGNTSVYVTGQGALNSLITTSQPGVFQGANVNITLEEQNFNTTNQVTSTINYAAGAAGAIQYNNGANGFAGSDYFTYTSGNVITPGIRTNGYFYGNGAPFTGGGNAAIGNFVFTGDTMSISDDANASLNIRGNSLGNNENYITINPTSIDIYAYNTNPYSYSELYLDNSNVSAPYAQIIVDGNATPQQIWNFGHNGNLTLPSNTSSINYANGSPYGGSGNASFLANGSAQFSLLSDYSLLSGNTTSPHNFKINDTYTPDIDLRNASGTGMFTQGAGATIRTAGTYNWTFGSTGNTQFPTGIVFADTDLIAAANTYIEFASHNGNTYVGVDNDNAFIQTDFNANNYSWTFAATGGTIFPTLTVQRGDNPSGTISGQTLLFGDATQEAIISTPDAPANSNGSSQRLVINPGAGDGSGEGGDIYLWAGRGGNVDGNGGDVKIRGGQATGNGPGGYIRIEAGDTQNNGAPGFIEITGGQGGTTSGGYVQITGGVAGSGTGGAVDLIGGFGQAGPGANVGITGGGSANGLAEYGNVNIGSGASTWSFRNNGTTQFPGNLLQPPAGNPLDIKVTSGNVYSTVSLYDTASQIIIQDNTTGANPAWALFEADLANVNTPQAVVILKPGDTGNEVRWTFNADGNLNLPSGGVITEGNIPAYTSLTGNTIVFTPSGGTSADQQLVIYPTATPGADANHLHLTSGNLYNTELFLGDDFLYVKLANTGNVVVNSNDLNGNSAQWTFGTDGQLTLPSGGQLGSAGMGWTGLKSANGTPIEIDSYYANGNISGQIYMTPNGNISLVGFAEGGASNAWSFNSDASVLFPYQSTNQRTGSGEALVFAKSSYQKVIATAPGDIGQPTVSRLVIAGGDGYEAGEGGDIYLWAGRSGVGVAGGSGGGDIKIDAGEALNSAQGGTVKIRGGNSYDQGIGGGVGGFVEILAGSGNTGGPVTISSGQGNSQANSGFVQIQTPYGGTWYFDNYGNLTTPGVSGNITGANVIIANIISALGDVESANVNAGTLSAIGNVIANNAVITQLITCANMEAVGNVVGNTVYAGNSALSKSQTSLANVIMIGVDAAAQYVQAVLINTGGNGSADWVSYSNNGNSDQGYVDMGMTGNTFNDPNYQVTDPNDGYILVQGTNTGTPLGGNLVLATGDVGLAHDIVFATGGFSHANIKARLIDATGEFSVVGNISGNYIFGNGSGLTGVGAASVPSQNILPTIQSIAIANTSNVSTVSSGQGWANVTVANAISVTEYGVIITSGTSSQKYATGALGNIPGTEKITFTTAQTGQQFTVYAYVTSNAGTYYSTSATGTSGICLLAGTQIALSDGSHKAIEDITYTDKLLSWDFDRGCYAETTALWIKRSETGSQYNLLTFSDGTTLRTFDQHRIFNKQAGAFTYPMTAATPVGTVTVNEHGQEIVLINKQVIQDTIEYYNVITDYHMNLFSDSVLTSCRFNNIYPVVDMKFVKDSRTPRTRAEFANIPDRFFHGLRLAEQTADVDVVEWYVDRLVATEVLTQSELAF